MSDLFLGKSGISLTGFMFTGKSSVGRALARRLGLKFIDLDLEITRKEKTSIRNIFAAKGEEEFRRLEKEALARVITVPGRVVATGGGVVIDPENRSLLTAHSCVIWLRASERTILERLRNSRGLVRPLLSSPEPEKEIVRLLEERDSYYRECDLAVDTDGLSVGEICDCILKALTGS